ncbi:manganese catalase family protein [Stenotrophomonas pavanii]|uniref:manganese catalase family protein n=1 Tax=Stenotrophomonas pavanii TaxID=487698 RepID=UPI002ACDEB40|nr:manganese catalase family protein [Stenotrophomonas pavanii]MDZ7475620.1 manganese catalase family protein [Stenotrophomonas pavanii]
MFFHHKKLMYTVRVRESNPQLASLMLEQFGGPQGELAAAMRYFTQGLGECDPGRKDLLMDIATEEISHLEIIGTIIAMLNRGPKAIQSEGLAEAEDMRLLGQNSTSHTEQLLYGGGPALVNSSGVPWTAAYVDSIGEPTADLRSNIAAEARAKLVYERLITVTDDPGIKDALRFLMTREIAHQKSFEKALHSIQPNFPPGKQPGDPAFTDWRWHGQPQIYRSAYSEQALAGLARHLHREAAARRRAWCVLDNTALGHATGDALHLQALLQENANA